MRAGLTFFGRLVVLASVAGCGGEQPKPATAAPPQSKEQEKQKKAADAQTWKKMTTHDPNNP